MKKVKAKYLKKNMWDYYCFVYLKFAREEKEVYWKLHQFMQNLAEQWGIGEPSTWVYNILSKIRSPWRREFE
jgi:hypothetical protein